jgi:BirA family transcriptional regulator, biotin operon repressor / biotin---[acetyl-CoA-carboxylase] ligase
MAFSLGSRAQSAGYHLAAFDQIGSTNAEGIAPRGNLASSILEVVDVSPAVAATLGFAAGLALETALQKVSIEAALRMGGSDQLKFSLKWPNDVLAGDKKLAGILLEAEIVADGGLAVVVGIGTNVVGAPEGTPTPATSLAALGVDISAEELFTALSDAWMEFRGIWDNGRGFAEIRRLWLERAARLGEKVAIQTGTSAIEGTFDTIDETGCMIVRLADGRRVPVSAGEVYFGNAASVGAA